MTFPKSLRAVIQFSDFFAGIWIGSLSTMAMAGTIPLTFCWYATVLWKMAALFAMGPTWNLHIVDIVYSDLDSDTSSILKDTLPYTISIKSWM